MFNKFFTFSQSKLNCLYQNSLILKNLDKLIFISILAVFIFSMFAPSDVIGVFALCTVFLTFINLLIKANSKIECNNFELFLLVYFMFVVISLAGSSLFLLSLKGFFKVITYLGFYLSLVQYLKDNKDKIVWIIFVIAGCLSIEVIQGLIQTVVRPEAISTWQDTTYLNPEQVINRVYGTLKPLNPNLFGGYLVASIPFLIASFSYLLLKENKVLSLISLILTLLSFYVLFQTGCRGAYLGLFAIIVFLVVVSYKLFKVEYKKLYSTIVAILGSLGMLFLMSVSSLRARIFSIFAMRTDSSNSFRFNVYNSCIDMFKDNWLLGIGLGNGNFREVYGLYMKTGFDALSAYNIYLETAVESGIFALVAFVIFLALTVKEGYYFVIKENYSPNVIFVCASLAGIIGLMVHGFVDTVFFRPQIQFIFWTMVAIIRVNILNKNIVN